MPDAVVIVQVPSFKVVFANRHAEAFTQRALGRPTRLADVRDVEGEVLRPDGRPFEVEEWPLMRAVRGEKVSDEDCIYRLPDGRNMTMRVSAAPVHDSDGSIVAALMIGRDVTLHADGDSASLERGL
jgi:hypothetical protein